jgi:hypothetical protein
VRGEVLLDCAVVTIVAGRDWAPVHGITDGVWFARRVPSDSVTECLNDSGPFVTENDRKGKLPVSASEVYVGPAYPAHVHAGEYCARPGRGHVYKSILDGRPCAGEDGDAAAPGVGHPSVPSWPPSEVQALVIWAHGAEDRSTSV